MTESAWLIEKGEGSGLRYYAPNAPGEWTSDHLQACRFSRRRDAEAIQFRHVVHGPLPEYDTRVCEHGWAEVPRDEPQGTLSYGEFCALFRLEPSPDVFWFWLRWHLLTPRLQAAVIAKANAEPHASAIPMSISE